MICRRISAPLSGTRNRESRRRNPGGDPDSAEGSSRDLEGREPTGRHDRVSGDKHRPIFPRLFRFSGDPARLRIDGKTRWNSNGEISGRGAGADAILQFPPTLPSIWKGPLKMGLTTGSEKLHESAAERFAGRIHRTHLEVVGPAEHFDLNGGTGSSVGPGLPVAERSEGNGAAVFKSGDPLIVTREIENSMW